MHVWEKKERGPEMGGSPGLHLEAPGLPVRCKVQLL
jgi:hypothetical protein